MNVTNWIELKRIAIARGFCCAAVSLKNNKISVDDMVNLLVICCCNVWFFLKNSDFFRHFFFHSVPFSVLRVKVCTAYEFFSFGWPNCSLSNINLHKILQRNTSNWLSIWRSVRERESEINLSVSISSVVYFHENRNPSFRGH